MKSFLNGTPSQILLRKGSLKGGEGTAWEDTGTPLEGGSHLGKDRRNGSLLRGRGSRLQGLEGKDQEERGDVGTEGNFLRLHGTRELALQRRRGKKGGSGCGTGEGPRAPGRDRTHEEEEGGGGGKGTDFRSGEAHEGHGYHRSPPRKGSHGSRRRPPHPSRKEGWEDSEFPPNRGEGGPSSKAPLLPLRKSLRFQSVAF